MNLLSQVEMATLKQLTDIIKQFRDERDWKQFHTPKDMVLSLILETSELAEHLQWKDAVELKSYIAANRALIGEELVDILYWVLLISSDFEIDLEQAFNSKMAKNREKYPIGQFRGSKEKYRVTT